MIAGAEAGSELAGILEEVRRIDVLSRRLVAGIVAGEFHSVFRGAGIEFDEVREYVLGDDPRSVDWNVTARTGRPFVKKYVDEREQTVLFLLDLSPSMDGGFGPLSPRRAAARVLACLALSAARNDDRAGLFTFGGRADVRVPPRKGAGHALRLVRDALALPAGTSGSDPSPALRLAVRAVRRRSVVFLLSDFAEGVPEEALARCARRHDLVAVRLLPPELAPPAAGLLRLRDPETGRAFVADAANPAVRAAWRERAEAWRERTGRQLRKAGADLMDVPLGMDAVRDPVAEPILRFFRMRESRGAKR